MRNIAGVMKPARRMATEVGASLARKYIVCRHVAHPAEKWRQNMSWRSTLMCAHHQAWQQLQQMSAQRQTISAATVWKRHRVYEPASKHHLYRERKYNNLKEEEKKESIGGSCNNNNVGREIMAGKSLLVSRYGSVNV
jgi:hypothetical protein